MKFRADINALRALAVLLVVLYHFKLSLFDGGFIGVDVFFVISGYLMTAIIIGQLETDTFSLLGFYFARAKRIVPALAFLCIALLCFGWFYIEPTGYKLLAKHIAGSISFLSNIMYWQEAGYFDTSSQGKWLLHTWSLSTEWQFYMVYPLFLILFKYCFGIARDKVKLGLWLLSIFSFALCEVAGKAHPEASFFLFPTRMWEMLAGGLAFLYADRFSLSSMQKKSVLVIGFLTIVLSSLLIKHNVDWPSWLTIIPVLGAVLIILANNQTSFISKSRILFWIGKWSYSIYLWHWPVWVSMHYLDITLTLINILIGVIVSILLGAISFSIVEQNAAQLSNWRVLKVSHLLTCLVSLILVASCSVVEDKGVINRLTDAEKIAAAEATNVNPRRNECLETSIGKMQAGVYKGCVFGNPAADLGAIVWGDSHGGALVTSIATAAGEVNKNVDFFATSGCLPIMGATRFTLHGEYPCRAFASSVTQQIDKLPSHIPLVLVARFSAYVDGKNEDDDKTIIIGVNGQPVVWDGQLRHKQYTSFIENALCELAKKRKVYVVLPIPEMGKEVPQYIAKKMLLNQPVQDIYVSQSEYLARNSVSINAINASTISCNVVSLNPIPYLCKDGKCYGSLNKVPLYQDDDHLSERGNRLLIPMFRNIFISKSFK